MNYDELISLAKRASTPDTQYIVEISQSPGQDAKITVRRVVEMASIETLYSNTDEHGTRPLEEGIARMQSEVDATERIAHRHNAAKRPIGVNLDEIVAFIQEHEHMNSGEGVSTFEVAAQFGLSVHGCARYHLDKLVKQKRIRAYEDPLTFTMRYKVVKHA